MSLELQSLPHGCQGTSPHQQGSDARKYARRTNRLAARRERETHYRPTIGASSAEVRDAASAAFSSSIASSAACKTSIRRPIRRYSRGGTSLLTPLPGRDS